MLKLTKTGIGLLTKQYRSVLRKCLLLNLGLFTISALNMVTAPPAVAIVDGNYSVGEHDANNIIENGFYYVNKNAPGNSGAVYATIHEGGHLWGTQIYQNYTSGNLYVRTKIDGNWTAWKAIATEDWVTGKGYLTSVSTGNIANSAVTDAKIASGITASKITQTASYRFVSDTEKAIWNSKANAATTLSGYGIGDAYTKTEVDSLLSGIDMSNYYTKSQTYSRYEIENLDSLNYYYTFRNDKTGESAEFALFLDNEKLSNVFEA